MAAHQKKRFAHVKEGPNKFVLVFLIVLLLPFACAGLLISTFDINDYRKQIEEALSEQTDREIKIKGPLVWDYSIAQGFSVSAQDVSISNPSWASRPLMAHIGHASLRIDMASLLGQKLNVVSLDLVKMQAQLEIGPDGRGNWAIEIHQPQEQLEDLYFFKSKRKMAVVAKPKKIPLILNIASANMIDSRLGFLDHKGNLTLFEIPTLALRGDATHLRLSFQGVFAGYPLYGEIQGGAMGDIGGVHWPFMMQTTISGTTVRAKGTLRDHVQKVVFDNFTLSAGKSKAKGNLSLAFGETPLVLKGNLEGGSFDLSDLSFNRPTQGIEVTKIFSQATKAIAKVGNYRLFSKEPMDLSILKAFNANLTLSFDHFGIGFTTLESLRTAFTLRDGQLFLSPFSVVMAGSQVKGVVRLDARTPKTGLALLLKGYDLEFAKLIDFGAAEGFISGKADLDFDVETQGQSSFDFASNANGTINLLMDTGTLSSGHLRRMAGGVVDVVLPGARALVSPGINCLAARYKIENGFIQTRGLLIDMDSTTIAGSGGISLPDEYINIGLQTAPKGVGLGAILPPMRIYGPLTKPDFSVASQEAFRKVTGYLSGQDNASTDVPNMLHIDGKNDCAVTLDNPAIARALRQNKGAKPLLDENLPLLDRLKGMGLNFIQSIGKKIVGQ